MYILVKHKILLSLQGSAAKDWLFIVNIWLVEAIAISCCCTTHDAQVTQTSHTRNTVAILYIGN